MSTGRFICHYEAERLGRTYEHSGALTQQCYCGFWSIWARVPEWRPPSNHGTVLDPRGVVGRKNSVRGLSGPTYDRGYLALYKIHHWATH